MERVMGSHGRLWTSDECEWLSARLKEHALHERTRISEQAHYAPVSKQVVTKDDAAYCNGCVRNGNRGGVNWNAVAIAFKEHFGHVRNTCAIRTYTQKYLMPAVRQELQEEPEVELGAEADVDIEELLGDEAVRKNM
jgi:hypothetical protein